MKVLLVTTSYPDSPGSHRGIFIRKLCLELMKNGLDVMVLTPRILSQSAYFENDSGIKVYRFWFPSNNKQLNQMGSIPMIPMAFFMISGLLKALYLIIKNKPDVIHGNWIVPTGLIAATAGCILRVPVLNTAHGMDLRISERQPIRGLFDLAIKLSNKTIIVSPSMKKRKSLQNAEVLPMGVDEVFFQLHPNRGAKTVLFTRSLEPVYDTETLIRSVPLVIKSIPEAKFIIAGSGSQEARLKDLAQKLEVCDSIRFLGLVPSDQIPALMEQASTYVSPAIADGTSPALLEAIAARLIPVVTDIDANRTLIKHGCDGYLFKPKDEKDLANNIIKALSQEISASILEQKQTEMKNMIHWVTIAKRFISIYNQLTIS
jgi:L-malate glycosyltransferase